MTVNLKMPVLLVDDYRIVRCILRNQLGQIGFENIDDAVEGQSALLKLQTSRYGLVISDWFMEPMSGLELLKEVRKKKGLEQTPFIMATAEAENRIAAQGAGADDYIVKPFDAHALKSTLANVLGAF